MATYESLTYLPATATRPLTEDQHKDLSGISNALEIVESQISEFAEAIFTIFSEGGADKIGNPARVLGMIHQHLEWLHRDHKQAMAGLYCFMRGQSQLEQEQRAAAIRAKAEAEHPI